MYHSFSVAEAIQIAWRVLKKNFATLIVYSVVSLFIYELVDFFNIFVLIDDDLIIKFVVIILQMIVQAYLALSFYKLILTLMDKEFYEFEFKDILPSIKMTFNFVVIAFLYAVLIALLLFVNLVVERTIGVFLIFQIVELGFILYLLLRSIFCVCFIVDDGSRPFESLRQSFEITKDNFFKTLGIFAVIISVMILLLIPVIFIINFFNLDQKGGGYTFKLAFYFWFLLTFPFVQVLIMVTYRKLVYSHKDVDDDIAETL